MVSIKKETSTKIRSLSYTSFILKDAISTPHLQLLSQPLEAAQSLNVVAGHYILEGQINHGVVFF